MSTSWNEVLFEKSGAAYQEIWAGRVQRYVNANGTQLFITPPADDSCRVLNESAEPTPAMADADTSRRVGIDATEAAAKTDLTARLRDALREVCDRASSKLSEAGALDPSLDAWIADRRRLVDAQ